MGRRKTPRVPPVRPQTVDATKAINIGLLVVTVCLTVASFWLFQQARHTIQYAQVGYAACSERFNPQYLNACNVQADGPSCQHETRSRLKDWYMEVDYRCAKAGPDVVFIARINEPPEPEEYEVAEAR